MPIVRRRTHSDTTVQPAGSSAVPRQRDSQEATRYPESAESRADAQPRHYGMATTLMILTGLLTCFIGITGIIRGVFFNRVATYPFYYSVLSRGVTLLVIGAVALVVGLALLIRRHWARHVATVVAVISAIANFMFMPFYPFWSIVVLALNVLIIWELTRESGRRGYALLSCPARVVSGCAHLNGLSRQPQVMARGDV
jgi:hypothetical protein